MKQSLKAVLLLILFLLWPAGHTETLSLILGDTPLQVLYQEGRAPVLVHLHQNETTAYTAIQKIAYRQGNAWLSLRHGGGRNIVFYLRGKRYVFDPNRIFTEQGIRQTLTRYSRYDSQAAREIARLARAIKSRIGERPVIAVHNNRGYSLLDYLPGHSLAGEASGLYLADKKKYRNFFLVTRQQDYNVLRAQRQNVVAQAPQAEDDGSLSVYLANRPYINVEAGFNQQAAQERMLQKADRALA